MNISFSVEDILEHAVADVIDPERIRTALSEGKRLKVKLGIDPTSPDVHLGRSIPLWKLRGFQELGCEIHLIIGDFTGQVGDTSDKDSERPMLSPEEVRRNMERYEEQLWMVLNPDKKDLVHFHHNSEWLGKLTLSELATLADAFSVNSFIKRELIARRLEQGSRVSLREMLYPVMQGFDSLQIAADVELGGTDQWFNLLAGRTLQEQKGLTPQSLILNPLISGTDGRKMSSSWGNAISLLDTAQDKFGKTMTVPDDKMSEYLLVVPRSAQPFTKEELESRMQSENPRDLKLMLAWTVTALYHGEETANQTRDAYIKQFSEGQLPEDIQEVSIESFGGTADTEVVGLLVDLGLAPSRSEARRLIEQGGVRINEQAVSDVFATIALTSGMLVQVGKRNFRRLV